MYRTGNGNDPFAARLAYDLWEIMGSWVSLDGTPPVRIFRNDTRKDGGFYLELAYNNPQAEYSCRIKEVFGVRYIDLFGRVGIAYDRERDVLLLSEYGEYIRAEEPTTN